MGKKDGVGDSWILLFLSIRRNTRSTAFFLLRCVVAPLRETCFLLFSRCGLALPLCEDFLPHATAQRRNVNSGKRKAYCGLCGTGHHSAQYAEYRYCALATDG